ncbi:MAG: AAA family ATPase [Minicystis sp.]
MRTQSLATGIRARLGALHRAMCEGLLEREEPARVLLLAALAGEHALLTGPPGTAKSELSRRLRDCLSEGRYFERLLTRFSVPEELFGPLSIKSLERDEYLRLVDGYLPTAAVAFLDEIFNANSAILNALLTLLNEREFDNGTRRIATPLVSVVAATNQVPDAPELAALHDRFLFRCQVMPVSKERFRALLAPATVRAAVEDDARLTPVETGAIRDGAERVSLPPAVQGIVEAMREGLAGKGIYVSDRRWRKVARILRVAALADERDEVAPTDCWLMLHCLWDRPEQIEVVEGLLRAALDTALVDEPRRYEAMTAAFEAEIEKERASVEHACDAEGRPLYRDEQGRETIEPYRERHMDDGSGSLLYRPPPGMPAAVTVGRERFTMGELWELHFQHEPDGLMWLETWVRGPAAPVIARELREGVMVPAKLPVDHLAARRRQLGELRGEIDGFRRGIAAASGDPSVASFWLSEVRRAALRDRLATAEQALAALDARILSLDAIVQAMEDRASGGTREAAPGT